MSRQHVVIVCQIVSIFKATFWPTRLARFSPSDEGGGGGKDAFQCEVPGSKRRENKDDDR